MADSNDELEPILAKVLPLGLEETSRKRKGNAEQDQHVPGHVEIANRKRLAPRTRKTLQRWQDGKSIEQQETSKSNEDQIEQHQKDAKASKEKRNDEATAKVDENDKNQRLEAQPDEDEKVEDNGGPIHKEEDHSDETDNDHDAKNPNRKVEILDDKGQKSTTRTKEIQIKNPVSSHGLLARAVSTVTKLQSWWKGGKAVTEHTGYATKDSKNDDETLDDEDQEDENEVDKNHDDVDKNDEDQEQPFQTSQLPDEESQQKEDLTPVPLPDTPPSSPVAYQPTPAAFFPSYSAFHHSMPAAFFAPAQSSASSDGDDDDDDDFLSKVFQVGQESKEEDLEEQTNNTAQDEEKQGDDIENEGKQVKVNRKDKIQEGHNSSASQSSSLNATPTTTTTTPPAPLALHIKRKHSPVPTPGVATIVRRAAPIAFHFGAKLSPALTSHGIEGPVLGTPFGNSSKYTPSFGPVSVGKTQSPYSKAGVFNQGKGQNPKTPASSEGKKEEEEQEPESDPDDRSPLTEEQMWEEMGKALRRIEKKKKT
ncbi:hypothetical protein CKM354_000610100 [Cercospora kikuchii]|uniref:Uncharacterized protein n=1 Tax=Cercospora kikuchii TaxID=84275 RepID=A0A9P3CHH7_9PEZI|nr:uncharacterized protein CKM354_000610100 [Cercospora kikuchii]GIZ42848.1 hypothetical protein CKM354_000610100 [Cercospora kikuchii]